MKITLFKNIWTLIKYAFIGSILFISLLIFLSLLANGLNFLIHKYTGKNIYTYFLETCEERAKHSLSIIESSSNAHDKIRAFEDKYGYTVKSSSKKDDAVFFGTFDIWDWDVNEIMNKLHLDVDLKENIFPIICYHSFDF